MFIKLVRIVLIVTCILLVCHLSSFHSFWCSGHYRFPQHDCIFSTFVARNVDFSNKWNGFTLYNGMSAVCCMVYQ